MACRWNEFSLGLIDVLRFFQEICMLLQGAGSRLPRLLRTVSRSQEIKLWQSYLFVQQEGV